MNRAARDASPLYHAIPLRSYVRCCSISIGLVKYLMYLKVHLGIAILIFQHDIRLTAALAAIRNLYNAQQMLS